MHSFFQRLNRCDYFFIISVLYYTQGVLYSIGTINKILQVVILVWAASVAYRYFLDAKNQEPLLNSISALVVMYIIYGGLFILFADKVSFGHRGESSYLYLQKALNSLLPIYVFYDYSMRGFLTSERFRWYCVPVLLLTIADYQRTYEIMLLESLNNNTEFTINHGYEFLAVFPIVCFFYKKPVLQYVLALVIMYYIVICMKRGAILVGGMCFLYFLYQNIKNARTRIKLLYLVITVAIFAIGYRFIGYMIDNSAYFNYRIQQTLDGDLSHRDIIVEKIVNTIMTDFTFFELLFGRGAYSTVVISGTLAHNDWIEMLCNNGLLGFVLLLFFLYNLFSCSMIKRKNVERPIQVAFVLLFIITFMKTLFSQSIMVLTLSQTMMMGYLISCCRIAGTHNYR